MSDVRHADLQTALSKETGRKITDEYLRYPIDDVKQNQKAIITYPIAIVQVRIVELLNKVKTILKKYETINLGQKVPVYNKLGSKVYLIQESYLCFDLYQELNILQIPIILVTEKNKMRVLTKSDLINPEKWNHLISDNYKEYKPQETLIKRANLEKYIDLNYEEESVVDKERKEQFEGSILQAPQKVITSEEQYRELQESATSVPKEKEEEEEIKTTWEDDYNEEDDYEEDDEDDEEDEEVNGNDSIEADWD